MRRLWLTAVLGLIVLTGSFAAAQEGNKSADLYGAWFTSGSVVPGQRYVGHPESVLPQPTKHFSRATEAGARLIIVLKNPNAHALAGVLNDSTGKVRQHMKVDLQSAAPGLAWRFTSYRFPLEKLEPGEYKFDLTIDGTPAGAYPLSIVP